MSKRDYYEVLGVGRTADAAAIKTAFRKLAVMYHPDKNPGSKAAEDKFKEASEAYEVLYDPSKRDQYDQLGSYHDSDSDGFSDVTGSRFRGGGVNINEVFSDLFGEMFGDRRRGRGRGADLRFHLDVTFEQAAFGCEAQVKIKKPKRCDACEGKGSRLGSTPHDCYSCHGSGQVRVSQGLFGVTRPCGKCAGSGKLIVDPCPECRGKGTLETESQLKVKVPPGVDVGTRLKLTGEGEPGLSGAPSGDLYVTLGVQEHPFFTREDTEVHCEVPITFGQAALGALLDVPTLDGDEKLRILAGTQTGAVFVIKGKGIPSLQGFGRGDQHVRVLVETPVKLREDQREMLRRFEASFR